MSEACQAGGHEMMNHLGRRIRVTERTIEALEIRGYLHRNRETGLKQISPQNYLVFVEAERATDWWHELGEDCSGPNVVVCRCPECQRLISDIDKTPLPGRNPLQDDEISRIVREVRNKYEQRR